MLLLSPLAEGADRLVARIGLEMGVALVVPLPLEREHYVEDFAETGSRAEFDELLARSDRHFVLPLLDGHDRASTARPGDARDLHYAQVGAYIARSSQVLIALWDGDVRAGRGGTADVVSFRLHGAPAELSSAASLLEAPVRGTVHCVVTPSRRPLKADLTPYEIRVLHPSGFESDASSSVAQDRRLERIERFNHDEQSLREALSPERARSRGCIAPPEIAVLLDSDTDALVDRYATADTLALHYQRRCDRGLYSIIGGVFVAVVFFEIYGHMLPDQVWLLGAHLVGLLVVWLVAHIVRRGEFQERYLDYRALAEGLRVQIFWRLGGLPDNVADFHLRKQRSVLDWIAHAIRTWTIGPALAMVGLASGQDAGLRTSTIARYWMADQAAYFRHAAERVERQLHRLERLVDFFFVAAVLIAVGQIGMQISAGDHHLLGHAPIFAVGFCLLVAGVLHGYIGRRALPELSKQYAQMAGIYGYANGRVEAMRASGDLRLFPSLLKELGIDALAENGDWLVLHRERPVEMPRGH